MSRGSSDYYSWNIDGKSDRVDRTNGRLPDELQNYFNLYYEPDKTKRYLNITSTGDPLLFVETTGGDNDRLLQLALGTEDIKLALKEAESIKRRSGRDMKLIDDLKEEKLEEQARLELQVNSRGNKLRQIRDRAGVLDAEYTVLQLIEKQIEGETKYVTYGQQFIGLKEIVDMYEESNIEKEIVLELELNEQYDKEQKKSEIETEYNGIKLVTKEELKEVEKEIKQVEQVNNVLKMVEKENEIKEAIQQHEENYDFDVVGLEQELKVLEQLVKMEELLENMLEKHGQVQEANEEYEQAVDEHNNVLDEIGICPYCGGEVGTHKH